MTFFEKIKAIERIDQLIRLKATGTPDELAGRMGVSRTTVYEIINCMKSLGAEIEYCRRRRSFYYATAVQLSIGFINLDKKQDKIQGGMKKIGAFFFRSGFSDTIQISLE